MTLLCIGAVALIVGLALCLFLLLLCLPLLADFLELYIIIESAIYTTSIDNMPR